MSSARKQYFWWIAFPGLILALIGVSGFGEPLWLDELHSSWVVSGTMEHLGGRAAAGNQSPVYFWVLKGLVTTLGHSAWVLRFPSLLASAISVGICGWLCLRITDARKLSPIWAVLATTAWISFDRIQWFYATEARVYAILQLVNLAGWTAALGLLVRLKGEPARSTWTLASAWSVLAVIAIYLHVLGVIAVIWQWLFVAGCYAHVRSYKRLRGWLVVLSVFIVLASPAVIGVRAVWQRREQWESFAGDPSLTAVLALFPLAQLLCPVLVCRLIDIGFVGRKPAKSNPGCDGLWQETPRLIWFIALVGPLLTGWLLTFLDIAPVFHRRYLLCCAMPLAILATSELARIRLVGLRIIALVTATIWLLGSQGNFQVWSQGQLVGWQRGEDWASAASWVNSRSVSDSQVWCASGLIEGKQAQLPLSARMDEYLSFPLRGIYHVDSDHRQPRALFGNVENWYRLWNQAGSGETHFIVYRGRVSSLESRLEKVAVLARQAGGGISVLEPPTAFGLVCVSKIRFD